jgi:hypothetical protein
LNPPRNHQPESDKSLAGASPETRASAAFAIIGIAIEVGIEPTVRHGADHGLVPVVVTDACGGGDHAAAKWSLDALATAGDAILTDIATITPLLSRPTLSYNIGASVENPAITP